MEIAEGGVAITVPEQPDAGVGEGVFFNPDQELNRDLTIAALRAARTRDDSLATYLDATAATGIRAVRAGSDDWDVSACDVDPAAIERTQANLERNDIEGEVHHGDVRRLLFETAYDVVDLDPFGTPMPIAEAAILGAKSLLCVTATDTAPLCGAHMASGIRTYDAVPRNTEYHAEMGLRILLSALIRKAATHERAATPIFSHVSDHYVRTYLWLESGAQNADACLENLGFVHHCFECLYRESEPTRIPDPPSHCPNCEGDHIVTAGPLWVGPAHERSFIEDIKATWEPSFGTTRRAERLLDRISSELHEPTHYDYHRLCKRWNRGAASMDSVIEALEGADFEASRTHFGGTTFKTTANVSEIEHLTEGLGD